MTEMNGVDLKTSIIETFKQKDPDMYEKIMQFKRIFNIDEVLGGRYSVSFLLDVFFAFEKGLINISAVLDEIKYLEGVGSKTQTKPASQFNRKPLKHLWHKHYSDGNIPELAQNVKNALKNYSIPYLDEQVRDAEASDEVRYITETDISAIFDDVVSGSLARRRAEQKMTGEWLVYASHEGQNYYLCLAKHDDGDDNIRKKIDSTGMYEYPFLEEVLS
ncbi:hypothetical protein L3V77_21080 [Vibrio sp. DW001]|uniref:hypothetical protein n=1 Tax=Vibrio sp. DW001 TaxID=2912315 RepID=UPI0023B1F3E7|nr:hypothetical protein [Vibrio sp. DW001]WED29903.1 hypothetical protein L3V77_21080 [Vibrio sp. DW001]